MAATPVSPSSTAPSSISYPIDFKSHQDLPFILYTPNHCNPNYASSGAPHANDVVQQKVLSPDVFVDDHPPYMALPLPTPQAPFTPSQALENSAPGDTPSHPCSFLRVVEESYTSLMDFRDLKVDNEGCVMIPFRHYAALGLRSDMRYTGPEWITVPLARLVGRIPMLYFDSASDLHLHAQDWIQQIQYLASPRICMSAHAYWQHYLSQHFGQHIRLIDLPTRRYLHGVLQGAEVDGEYYFLRIVGEHVWRLSLKIEWLSEGFTEISRYNPPDGGEGPFDHFGTEN